jgi:hypothetical protein
MKRKALLRDGEQYVVLEESEFEAEQELQEALKRNPEAIPVADLDLNEVVVVGRETPVPAGAIDLLLLDGEGQVIIVETKLSRNPELRRQVVAQVLDYGASLWRTAPGLKEFEAMVLRYWHSDACEDDRVKHAESLREGLETVFFDLCGEDWDYDAFEEALAGNLEAGRHVLLVVASGLMDRLSRDLLQYANMCLSLPLYGVEIDVFETAARQLIIPRGVRFAPPGQRTGASPRPSRRQITRAEFLEKCMPPAVSFFQSMLDEAEKRQIIVYWGSAGFSVRLPLASLLTIMYGYPPATFQVYTYSWPMDQEELTRAIQRLRAFAPFTSSGMYTQTLHLEESTVEGARAALAYMWEIAEQLTARSNQLTQEE